MDVLYKYVTHQRALTCIPEVGDGTLRATQPAALNDPFECAVATDYCIPGEREENRQLADILTQVNESKPVTAEDVVLRQGKVRQPVHSPASREAGFDKVRHRLFCDRSATLVAVVPLHHRRLRIRHRLRRRRTPQGCRLGRIPATRSIPEPATPDRRADCFRLARVESAAPPVLQEQQGGLTRMSGA